MKICIGIVSYLPSGSSREVRKELFTKEIEALNKKLNLPILVVAQNYTEKDKNIFTKNCDVDYYDKLGVTKARDLLRKKFLESKYDYVILLDDDEIIDDSGDISVNYLETIYNNPDKYINYYKCFLRGCAVSRYILERIPFLNIDAQKLEGWDDALYVECVKKLYPDRYIEFPKPLDFICDIEKSNRKFPSTWVNNISDVSRKILDMNFVLKQDRIRNTDNFSIPEEWLPKCLDGVML